MSIIQDRPTLQSIETTVIRLAAEQGGIKPDQVTPATQFQADLNYDSLDTVEFVMAAEEAFSISIPDADAESAKTVGDAVRLIARGRGLVND